MYTALQAKEKHNFVSLFINVFYFEFWILCQQVFVCLLSSPTSTLTSGHLPLHASVSAIYSGFALLPKRSENVN